MKRLLFTLFTGISLAATTQKAALLKQLPSFVPKGFAIKNTAFGDLNNDKKMDVVLIAYNTREDDPKFEDTAMNIGRPLMILLQQADGKLKLAKRNDNMIMCKQCGGMMGDPFESVTIKNNAFTLEFYGGSSWRWGDTYGFSWDAAHQTWQLTKENHVSSQSGDPEPTTKITTIPASEISNLSIDNFNINLLAEQQDVTGKVTAAKCYFYNAPNPTTKRKAYVTKGDIVNIVREYNTFYQAYFTNTKEQITTGYVLKKDVGRLK